MSVSGKKSILGNYNYGVKGWLFTLYCLLAWMFVSGGWWSGSAQNTMIAQKTQQIGVDNAALLSINSVAGYISVALMLVLGIIFGKYGSHICQSIVMIAGGIAVCFYGSVRSIAGYAIIFLCVDCMANATSTIGLPQMCIRWFPKKKGSVMSIAAAGTSLAPLITLTVLNLLTDNIGIEKACFIFGAATISMGVINWIFIPDDPMKAGFRPDNGDYEPGEMERQRTLMTGPQKWTNAEAAKNKNFWLIGIAYGFLMMATLGVMAQYVPYQVSMNAASIANDLAADTGRAFEDVIGQASGMAASSAANILKLLPAFAIPGSIFAGRIDQKFGARRAGMLMAAGYTVSTLCGGFMPYNSVTNYIFIFVYFWFAGGNTYLAMSHVASVFGPRDYPHVYGRLQFLLNGIRVCSPLVLSVAIGTFGTYRWAYRFYCVTSIIAFIFIFLSDQRVEKEPGNKPSACYKN